VVGICDAFREDCRDGVSPFPELSFAVKLSA